MECYEELWRCYERYRRRMVLDQPRSSAHEGAMKNVISKLARIAAGRFHEDNYVDLAAYIAIAFEVEVRDRASAERPQVDAGRRSPGS
jgi:Domain of unknown function (DUF6378)